MSLPGLVSLITCDPVIASLVSDARSGQLPVLDVALPPAMRPLVAAALTVHGGRPSLIVTPTYREAEHLTESLASILSPDAVAYYPAWETLPHERLSPRSDTVGRRLAVLRRLAGNDEKPAPVVIVAPVRSMLQPQVKGLGNLKPVTVVAGEDYDITELERDLVNAAYVRVDLVQRRGEFAVRGGIIDVFPPTEEHPVRIDFFGDTAEEIRPFAVADQRSFADILTEVVASPCRELLLNDTVRARAAALVQGDATLPANLRDMLERISQGHAVDGMEALSSVLVDGLQLLADVVPDNTQVLVFDPERIRARADELVRTSQEFLQASWAAAADGGQAPIDLAGSSYRSLAEVRTRALERGLSWWTLSPFAATVDVAGEPDQVVTATGMTDQAGQIATGSIRASETENWRGDTDRAVTAISQAVRESCRVVLGADGRGLATRLAEVLGNADVPVRLVTDLVEEPQPGCVTIVQTPLRHGFRHPAVNLQFVTSGDVSGQRDIDRSTRKMPARRKNQIDPLELQPGDPVVHEQQGVGRYVEMIYRSVAGATREYLVIEYAPSKRGQPGDRLYVPMDQLDQITRYVGSENPMLDRMGGADWKARKSRARKAVSDIAAGLVKLYAARQASRGFAFSPDTPWQRELEDNFTHIETPDQLAAIAEVKQDMEQIVPMDRLICGDVGYGKTEIAVRAAFKAVMDAKQVAVLVPTTLLVQQHHATFSDRFAGFPVRVASLSRFQSSEENRKVRDGLADGSVDVVVGTHALLSSETRFKDLGLVIIDEEQRFGVEHKEALKKLRLNVDVLAMSATPIPRTLEMAISGIREMSVIATPPEERHPVLTMVGPYDDKQVRAAIRRELAREGQVFYIHNRVNTIARTASHLAELVPEARIMVAHGKMSEKSLEQVMVDFWERRADVLVCTTIVEAGLDISTANTLIVEHADHFGLSQLHQLRGRVGRGRERGYAYFLYPPERPLSETAHNRLATMAAHTDLGAGMAIAMKDLEIRGAGTLLGGEQSGHIADVGFDLYIRLVGEAVADYRGETTEPEEEMKIELPLAAHIPWDYVDSERLRLEMYKRLAQVRSDEDVEAVRQEMLDRYGPLPAPVELLLAVSKFRLVAKAAGLTEIVSAGNNIRFAPAELSESRQLRLARLYPGAAWRKAGGFLLVPRPLTAPIGGKPVVDQDLLIWCNQVVKAVFS